MHIHWSGRRAVMVVFDGRPLTSVLTTSLGTEPSVSMNIFTTQYHALPSPVFQSSIEMETALPGYPVSCEAAIPSTPSAASSPYTNPYCAASRLQ